MAARASAPPPFRYDGYELDPAAGRLVCRYSMGSHRFTEVVEYGPPGDMGRQAAGARRPGAGEGRAEAVDAAARLVFLLAGVSYYKTAAPPVVDLGPVATTERERRFLRTYYIEGLAEFAYRNHLDLTGLRIDGADAGDRHPIAAPVAAGRPLVPFGGGIDSVVTVEAVRRVHADASLFVVSRAGDRFDALERAAAVTGLPVVRADRSIDPAVLRSATHGYLNGHVPVTGILSAVAVLAAVTGGHGAVVMSNERSASAATLETGGRSVNHQWSKSFEFESAFRALLAETFAPGVDYFSYLRSHTELWVAERFAALTQYHHAFRSCNRAFHLDRDRRLDSWCAVCDKCCFIDLVLAPFMAPAELSAIFGGREPLDDVGLRGRFSALLGTGEETKPFECVGDAEECRAAALLAARRPDRAGQAMLQQLAAEALAHASTSGGEGAAVLVAEGGPDFVPAHYAGTTATSGPVT